MLWYGVGNDGESSGKNVEMPSLLQFDSDDLKYLYKGCYSLNNTTDTKGLHNNKMFFKIKHKQNFVQSKNWKTSQGGLNRQKKLSKFFLM